MQDFLDTADSIGQKLCRDAVWSGNRCNWIGRATHTSEDKPTYSPLANKALGGDLYDGSSGIALFLGYLYLCTGKEEYATTANGAINHALSYLEKKKYSSQFGFYNGTMGVAYVASRLASLLGDNILSERVATIILNLHTGDTENPIDVISGNAGAIPALLKMFYDLEHSKLLELAVSLGNQLLALAVKEKIGWSWGLESNEVSVDHNLTGFSHGAAGIGYSLLELFHVTGQERFRHAAEQAFKYENHWFDKEKQNWPDFRKLPGIRNEGVGYGVSWCHGAPGIGLSRLRAYQILKDNQYLDDCKIAIETTSSSMEEGNPDNYSLCHGLAGNAELLLSAGDILSDFSCKKKAEDIGRKGIRKYAKGDLSWPCGITTGQTPGLMLGLAGIGYFYLRLYNLKKIPSILIVSPDN